MTKAETVKIVEVLKTAYPVVFREFTLERMRLLVDVWYEILAPMPYDAVRCAVLQLIGEDERGYMPPVGAVAARAKALIPAKVKRYAVCEIDGEICEVEV